MASLRQHVHTWLPFLGSRSLGIIESIPTPSLSHFTIPSVESVSPFLPPQILQIKAMIPGESLHAHHIDTGSSLMQASRCEYGIDLAAHFFDQKCFKTLHIPKHPEACCTNELPDMNLWKFYRHVFLKKSVHDLASIQPLTLRVTNPGNFHWTPTSISKHNNRQETIKSINHSEDMWRLSDV